MFGRHYPDNYAHAVSEGQLRTRREARLFLQQGTPRPLLLRACSRLSPDRRRLVPALVAADDVDGVAPRPPPCGRGTACRRPALPRRHPLLRHARRPRVLQGGGGKAGKWGSSRSSSRSRGVCVGGPGWVGGGGGLRYAPVPAASTPPSKRSAAISPLPPPPSLPPLHHQVAHGLFKDWFPGTGELIPKYKVRARGWRTWHCGPATPPSPPIISSSTMRRPRGRRRR